MKKRVLFWMAMACLLLLLADPKSVVTNVNAAEEEGDWAIDLVFEGSDVYIGITEYHGNDEHIVIPQIVHEARVDYIKPSVFKSNTTIKSVEVLALEMVIPSYAFTECINLETVTLPDLVKLRDHAFAGCTSLREINIPEQLKKIEKGTFMNCTNLRKVVFPATLTKIESDAFLGCTGISEIQFYSYVDIAPDAFEGVTATVYYSGRNWSEERRENYGGNLTWVDVSPYKIIREEDRSYERVYKYDGKDVSIRLAGPIDIIESIVEKKQNDLWGRAQYEVLDPSYYTLEKISDNETKLSLKPNYLESIPLNFRTQEGYVDEVEVYFRFKDGYQCGVTVGIEKKYDQPTEPPATTEPTQPATEATTLPTTEPTEATTLPMTEPTEVTTIPVTEPTGQQNVPTEAVTQPTEQTTRPETQPTTIPATKDTTVPKGTTPDPSDSEDDGSVLPIVIAATVIAVSAAGGSFWLLKKRKR